LSDLQNQNTNLQSQFNHKEFVEATVNQLNKDLLGIHFTDLTTEFKDDSSVLSQLIQNLRPVLQKLAKNQPGQLSQFIYRVDLNEQKFIDSLSKDPEMNDLSYLIIEREAQKVYLRSKFS